MFVYLCVVCVCVCVGGVAKKRYKGMADGFGRSAFREIEREREREREREMEKDINKA